MVTSPLSSVFLMKTQKI